MFIPFKIQLQQPNEHGLLDEQIEVVSDIDFLYRVILFNDEEHDFEEVIEQIIKAINCIYAKAEQLTLEVHNNGKAIVFEGIMVECIRVSSILEEINLRTQIEF